MAQAMDDDSAPHLQGLVFTADGSCTELDTLTAALAARRTASAPGGTGNLIWIDIDRPTDDELSALQAAFGLHPLAVEDAREGNQRMKFERYGQTSLLALRPAAMSEAPARPAHPDAPGDEVPGEDESLLIGELEIFVGAGFVISAHRSGSPLAAAREFSRIRELLRSSPALKRLDASTGADRAHGELVVAYTLLHLMIDRVVDLYTPVLESFEETADDLEVQIFKGTPVRSQEIYAVSRGILDLDRVVKSLPQLMVHLRAFAADTGLPDELLRNLRDVADHVGSNQDRLGRLRSILSEIFSINSTLVAERQGDQSKRISAWAGIFFFPSLVAGIYGMNFVLMPELDWKLGYPAALGLMAVGCIVIYWISKHNDWL
ncbi:magnesium and cobalt transport protein CorA [Brevibacterium sp. 50QC2O2]|uniref:magnesium and cobalt transport protein CorA n=1 Tax=Brevibacterium TaxID=1696 RepID=UPI00211C71EA|nr:MULTISPECIES: magnesium and cobalt transport protein CorA [unclassified Brevibacterium]MCQ9386669.1 magnesium and cobalt transport protein CorA [Brevibacterium sp. 68QC2CO]MCQ9388682.1 magnesium and cobalt transport protein CorA [Brevibacterium sp. 50QC2O2]